MDVFKIVAKGRGDSFSVLETGSMNDSKGHGEAEKTVYTIEELVRTLLIDLEDRCGEKLSVTESFFPLSLEHACDLLNWFKVRKGNNTAWAIIEGNPYA